MLPSPPRDRLPQFGREVGEGPIPIIGNLRLILRAMRLKHWIKNLVLFAPLVFAERLYDPVDSSRALVAFFLFCLLASAVYIINDIADRKADRYHPEKARRPIASGDLALPAAVLAAGLLLAASLTGAWILSPRFFLTVTLYLGLNLAYSFRLKKVVILDVMSISAGFLLRAIGGAVVISVEISPWLILCTILLSLFLGFSKRRQELTGLSDQARQHRDILSEYSTQFLDQMISIVTAATLITYSFYTLSPEVQAKLGTHQLHLTIPFVLYGIFRYLYLVYQKQEGGDPTRTLLTDRSLLVVVMLWGAAVVLILYGS